MIEAGRFRSRQKWREFFFPPFFAYVLKNKAHFSVHYLTNKEAWAVYYSDKTRRTSENTGELENFYVSRVFSNDFFTLQYTA